MSKLFRPPILLICLVLPTILIACGANVGAGVSVAPTQSPTAVSREVATLAPIAPTHAATRVTPTETARATAQPATPTEVVTPTPEPATPTPVEPTLEAEPTGITIADGLSEPLLAVLNAYILLGDAQSFRVTSDVCPVFIVSRETFEFSQPNLYRRIEVDSEGNSEVVEVAVGDSLYLKREGEATSTWEIYPRNGMIANDPNWIFTVGDDDSVARFVERMKTWSRDARLVGQETLDGRTMQVYEFETADPTGIDTATYHNLVWIGEADGRLHKKVESWEGIDVYSDEPYSCAPVATYEYDLLLEIEPPVLDQ